MWVEMTRHVKGCVKPWEWEHIPLPWHDWVLVSMDIAANLNTPPEKS